MKTQLDSDGYEIHREVFGAEEVNEMRREADRVAAVAVAGRACVRHLRERSALFASVSVGDVLLMSPLILHASRRSRNPTRRRVVHIEYAARVDLDPLLAWHEV